MTTTQTTAAQLKSERQALEIKMAALEAAAQNMVVVPSTMRAENQTMFDRVQEIDGELRYLERVEIMGQDEADSFIG